MGDYQVEKFDRAMNRLGNPWSIEEHGLIMKAYPACGYSHRVIDAAIELHDQLGGERLQQITQITISVPDYYLDLLTYANPESPSQAMFSAEYNVVTALIRGAFELVDLREAAIFEEARQQLLPLCKVIARSPPDCNIVYDPADPDFVEVCLNNGEKLRAETRHLSGSTAKPLSETAFKKKFDSCLSDCRTPAATDALWQLLLRTDELGDIGSLLAALGSE